MTRKILRPLKLMIRDKLSASQVSTNDITMIMRAKLDELDFDFNHFTIERFKQCIENRRGRKIFFIGVPLTEDLDGFWLSDAELPHEYIIYDNLPSRVFQIHTQVHELGHLINDHQTEKITTNELKAILQSLRENTIPSRILKYALHRSADKELQEVEAETFAVLVQKRAIWSARMEELIQASSTNDEATAFLESLGLS
jgi:hypothetical protein